jgi:hypothetical protein
MTMSHSLTIVLILASSRFAAVAPIDESPPEPLPLNFSRSSRCQFNLVVKFFLIDLASVFKAQIVTLSGHSWCFNK